MAQGEYAELVMARKSLPTAGDTTVIDGLLDSIRAPKVLRQALVAQRDETKVDAF